MAETKVRKSLRSYFGLGKTTKPGPGIMMFQGDAISDMLRIEQAIETNAGKVALTVPVAWNGESARVRKELPRKCWDGTRERSNRGENWIVVKEEIMATLECIKCHGLLEVWNKIVEEDGKEKLKWYLFSRRPRWSEFDGKCEKWEDKE